MRLYCGVNEQQWNRHPVRPGRYACVSPVYGATERTKRENAVTVPTGTIVLQDSGAFSDGPGQRLDFQAALARQIEHGRKYGYTIEGRASYDLLIDEKWRDGQRSKARWSAQEAHAAVEETIAAADYLRCHYDGQRVLSAQGVTPGQYLDCVRAIVPMLADGDILGLGGWCISGRIPTQMMITFTPTMTAVIPYAAQAGVKRAHIWGVIDSEFVGPLLWLCDRHNIQLSADSAGPQLRPARNGEWGYKGWKKAGYERPPVATRGLHRAIHVQLTRCWLAHGLRKSPYYHEPKQFRAKYAGGSVQLSMF